MRARDTRTLGIFDAPATPKPPPDHDDGLRWYQEEAVRAAQSSLLEAGNRSALIVMATAMGKTQTFSAFARRWKDGRVLVLAHRDELVSQAAVRLTQMTGEHVEIEQASLKSNLARIVVGSIQTVYREGRLERLEKRGGFGLIIVDEAHHYVSKTYRVPFERFANAKILGVTATPDRTDARALGQIFDDVCYRMDIRDGVDHGFLSPLRGREVTVEDVNLDNIDTIAGDLSAGQLDEAMASHAEGVVKSMLAFSGQRQSILFMPGVASARAGAARMNALKENCAASIDGETDKEERKSIVERFRRGEIQHLVNCMIATEGFDAPTASIVGIARPTKSRSLYTQMVGRGLRVLPGVIDSMPGRDSADARKAAIADSKKPFCTIIDFSGNNTRHSLMSPADVLGGKYDEDVRERAKKMAKEDDNQERDVDELLEEASKRVAKEKQEKLERAARSYKGSVKATTREFNPLSLYNIDESREREYTSEYGYKPPSERQLAFLRKMGWAEKELRGLSSRTVSKLIGSTIDRKNKGLMTKPQSALLSRYGVTGDMPAKVASQAIKYVKSAGANIDPVVLRQMVSGEEF